MVRYASTKGSQLYQGVARNTRGPLLIQASIRHQQAPLMEPLGSLPGPYATGLVGWGGRTFYIEPGSPRENGCNESFDREFRRTTERLDDLPRAGRTQSTDRAFGGAATIPTGRPRRLSAERQAPGDIAQANAVAIRSKRSGPSRFQPDHSCGAGQKHANSFIRLVVRRIACVSRLDGTLGPHRRG